MVDNNEKIIGILEDIRDLQRDSILNQNEMLTYQRTVMKSQKFAKILLIILGFLFLAQIPYLFK
jgi:hypothetical protein